MKEVDIKIIAAEAGVSIATVSRAFNENSSIKNSTRKKIIELAKKYNYRPNHIARGLSTKRTDTIGLILPELHDEFFMEIVHSIDLAAHKANKYLMVASSFSQRNTTETIIEFMSSGRVDGMIVMLPKLDEVLHNHLLRRTKPVVFLNNWMKYENSVNFYIDNYTGAKSAVEHLINHGYKKIAMLSGPESNSEALERKKGYLSALKENNIEFNKALIYEGDFTINSGFNGLLKLFKSFNKPEAIFAANDMMAVGVYQAAKQLKLLIPKDIAVVGFDNISLSNLLEPKLTTVNVPISVIANKAVKYLLNMIETKSQVENNYSEKIKTDLIIRESCGCKII